MITLLAIDLAKTVFQLHGVDSSGKPLLRKRVGRQELTRTLAQLPAGCAVAMEACGGAHFWARKCRELGLTPRIIQAKFVKPFVKSNKNDVIDAEAIAEAAQRPSMRFVAVKEVWQQEIQHLHRLRSQMVKQRTALRNEIRGIALEYGVTILPGEKRLREAMSRIREDESLPVILRRWIEKTREQEQVLDQSIEELDREIERIAQSRDDTKRLQSIPGIGPLTATAAVAAMGSPSNFKNGREFSASLGLVPRQHSSGGQSHLLGISKRGDRYLRTLLIHGGRSVLAQAPRPGDDRLRRWGQEKARTRGVNRAAVAMANKNARLIHALLSGGKSYESRTR